MTSEQEQIRARNKDLFRQGDELMEAGDRLFNRGEIASANIAYSMAARRYAEIAAEIQVEYS